MSDRHYMDDDEDGPVGAAFEDDDEPEARVEQAAEDAGTIGGGAGNPDAWDWADAMPAPVGWAATRTADAFGDVLAYDPYTPLDLLHDGIKTVERTLGDDPDDPNDASIWSVLEGIGEKVEDTIPGMQAVAIALGLGTAGSALLAGAGGFALLGGTLYLLGYSPNVTRAIKALDPSEAIRAANPF